LVQIELQVFAITINPETERQRDDLRILEDYNFIKRQALPNSRGTVNEYFVQKKDQMEKEGSIQLEHLYINSTAIAGAHQYSGQIPLKDFCSELGLWPAMNRSILYFLNPLSSSWNSHIDTLNPIGQKMVENLNYCGNFIDPLSVARGTYSRFALSHLYETKRLFSRYWTESGDKQINLIIDKSNSTPFQNLICTE
jgi:hypothetical protein